jgi:hypothetical protein
MERRIEQGVAVAVKFDRSIAARSARMECGFFKSSKSIAADMWYKGRLTITYDVIKSINDGSDRGIIIRGELERLTNARKASCAVHYDLVNRRRNET